MIEVTRAQVAELRGCTPSTVSRATLPKTKSGNYDLLNSEVWNYVISPAVDSIIRDLEKTIKSDHGDLSQEELDAKKTEVEILRIEKQNRKLDREHEEKSYSLIYRNDVAIGFGAFISGIKNNFLQIGNRVARGDNKLRDRIEKEVGKSIEKTIKNAQDEVQKIIKLELE